MAKADGFTAAAGNNSTTSRRRRRLIAGGGARSVKGKSEMPDKVPLWILKNTFCSFGRRMTERPETISADMKICATCQAEMYSYKDWNYCGTLFYCNQCIFAARQEETKRWSGCYTRGFVRLESEHAIPRTESEIPEGNLDTNDYAFWIGNIERYSGGSKSLRATCRACGDQVFGDAARLGHKTTSQRIYTCSLTCPKVLMLCYQQLLKLDHCMVCGIKTFGKQKWGVPLCTPNCIKQWMFDETAVYENLDKGIQQYWMAAPLDQKTGGSTTTESSSSPIRMSTSEVE